MLFKGIKCLISQDQEVNFLTIASGPVIFDDKGMVLLTKDDKDDFWKFAGGTVNSNESFENAAKREAIEETGQKIVIKKTEPAVMILNPPGKVILLIHFLAEFESTPDTFTPRDENIKDVRFFHRDQLPKNLASNVQPVLEYFSSGDCSKNVA